MDTLNLYPKTSCPDCRKEYVIPSGFPSNISVPGCEPSPYFECYERVILGEKLQPSDKEGWAEYNPNLYNSKMDKTFGKIPKSSGVCPGDSYTSSDPRQFDTLHAQWLPLDRPPMNGKVKLTEIYDKKYNGYGQGSMPYTTIVDGDITYYRDRSIADAFYRPVYSEPAKETAILYHDPMGLIKPEYNRTPLINTENPVTTVRGNFPYCLSFLQDTQSFREDIMALQQRKNNQSKWTARWG
jgi:hypothetical protein